jgi:hypothetical protein
MALKPISPISKLNMMSQRNFACILIFLAAAARLIPHGWNFTPLAAIGLFGAAYFGRRSWGLLVPFIALFISDLFLNNVIYSQFYEGFTFITSWWVYAGFAAVVLIGLALLQAQKTPQRVLMASILASLAFFLVSNLSTFFETTLYPRNAAGLLACYTAGLPFLKNTLLGDMLYCTVLFGVFEWVKQRGWATQTA